MRVGSKRLRFQKNGRRKFIIFIVVLCLIAAAVVGAIYLARQPGGFSSLFEATPSPTATAWQLDLETSAAPAAPIVTLAPSSTSGGDSTDDGSTPTDTSAVTDTSSGAGSSSASGAAFLGNSNLEDLYTYNLIPDADFYYKIGLTVDEVHEETADGGSVPIIEELEGKDYDKIFLMFGNNELGWDSLDQFLEGYKDVIDSIREEEPNARIYVMGILPVTEELSDKAEDGVTQERIDEYNEELKTFANDNDCYFMDLGLAMKGTDGYLPAEAAEDGVHLNRAYSARWAEILRNEIGGEAG